MTTKVILVPTSRGPSLVNCHDDFCHDVSISIASCDDDDDDDGWMMMSLRVTCMTFSCADGFIWRNSDVVIVTVAFIRSSIASLRTESKSVALVSFCKENRIISLELLGPRFI